MPTPIVVGEGRLFLAAGYGAGSMMLHLQRDGEGITTKSLFRVPPEIFGVPCYDFVGSSYRMNYAGSYFGGGGGASAEFTIAPYGHRMSTLENTARQTYIMEPLFYSMTIQAARQGGGLPRDLILFGWHGAAMTSNVGFVDGSARSTRVQDLIDFDQDTLNKMRYYTNPASARRYLRRGETWQMDCYPTPGAFVPKFTNEGAGPPARGVGGFLNANGGWPTEAFQNNMRQPN